MTHLPIYLAQSYDSQCCWLPWLDYRRISLMNATGVARWICTVRRRRHCAHKARRTRHQMPIWPLHCMCALSLCVSVSLSLSVSLCLSLSLSLSFSVFLSLSSYHSCMPSHNSHNAGCNECVADRTSALTLRRTLSCAYRGGAASVSLALRSGQMRLRVSQQR